MRGSCSMQWCVNAIRACQLQHPTERPRRRGTRDYLSGQQTYTLTSIASIECGQCIADERMVHNIELGTATWQPVAFHRHGERPLIAQRPVCACGARPAQAGISKHRALAQAAPMQTMPPACRMREIAKDAAIPGSDDNALGPEHTKLLRFAIALTLTLQNGVLSKCMFIFASAMRTAAVVSQGAAAGVSGCLLSRGAHSSGEVASCAWRLPAQQPACDPAKPLQLNSGSC
jgi:hypothetical protein